MAKAKRSKRQVSFQFPPDVAVWVEEEERKTGVTRGRIGIAAILMFILGSKDTRELCMQAATGIDLKELTLDEVLANVVLAVPGVLAPVDLLQEYVMKFEFPPEGEIPQEYIDESIAAARRDPKDLEIVAEVEAQEKEEYGLAWRRMQAARARLDAKTAGKSEKEGKKDRKRREPKKKAPGSKPRPPVG